MPVSFLGPARLRAASSSEAPEALSGLWGGAGGGGAREGGGGKDSPPRGKAQRTPRGHLPTRQQSPGAAHREGDPGGRGCSRQDGSGSPPGGDGCRAVFRRKSRSPAQEQRQEGCRPRRQPQRLQKGHGQRALCPAGQDRHKTLWFVPPVTRFSQKQSLPTFPGPPTPMPGPIDTDKDQTRP